MAEHGVAHRDRDAPAEVAHRRAPDEAVGRLQADAAHPAVADLLGHLGRDRGGLPVELEVHLDGVVDLGQGVGRELDVDDRAGDGDDPAVGQRAGRRRCPAWWWWSSGQAPFDWRSASAPPTISMISVVMASWRARFMTRRQGADELVGVVGGRRHGPLLGREDRGGPLEQGGEDLRLDGPRRQLDQQLRGLGLELGVALERPVVLRRLARPRHPRAAGAAAAADARPAGSRPRGTGSRPAGPGRSRRPRTARPRPPRPGGRRRRSGRSLTPANDSADSLPRKRK